MRVALSYARGFGGRIVQHPEDPSLADGGAATEGELATRLGLPGIPVAAEAILVARDIRLAALTGGAVHFAHVSTAEALRLIRQAKADGIAVTCDTAPPYFDLNETAIGDFRTYAKLSPPLRKEADRLAVVAALADGTIDAIASDHQPRDADDKRQPFALATPGGTGLATLLGVTLAQVHSGALALAQAIELLTARPAALLGVDAGAWPRAGRRISACSTPSACGRWKPAACPARRRTRRSTAARWRAWCWARGRPGGGCSGRWAPPVRLRPGLMSRTSARAKSAKLRVTTLKSQIVLECGRSQQRSLESMVNQAKLRWRIERDYLELKQEVGLGHYEGRGWRGFHHHATLCVAAYGFLISEKESIPPPQDLPAPGDARNLPFPPVTDPEDLPCGHNAMCRAQSLPCASVSRARWRLSCHGAPAAADRRCRPSGRTSDAVGLRADPSGLARNRTTTDSGRRRESGIMSAGIAPWVIQCRGQPRHQEYTELHGVHTVSRSSLFGRFAPRRVPREAPSFSLRETPVPPRRARSPLWVQVPPGLWTPTRPAFGEGRTIWGSSRQTHLDRSTGVMGTAPRIKFGAG